MWAHRTAATYVWVIRPAAKKPIRLNGPTVPYSLAATYIHASLDPNSSRITNAVWHTIITDLKRHCNHRAFNNVETMYCFLCYKSYIRILLHGIYIIYSIYARIRHVTDSEVIIYMMFYISYMRNNSFVILIRSMPCYKMEYKYEIYINIYIYNTFVGEVASN